MKNIPLLISLAAFASLSAFAKAKINKCEVFNYDTPDKTPIWFGGESRSENVEGGGQYCIFIDIYYADGSHTWAKQAQFPIGTHDWVRSENVFIPHKPPAIEDVEYAVSRGMNSFVIANIVPQPKNSNAKWVCRAKPWEVFNEKFYNDFVSRMRPYVEQLRAKRLDIYAMFYGFDECGTEYFEKMREQWLRLKKDLGIPVMTTAYMFRNVVRHNIDFDSPYATMTDVHCPPMIDYDPLLADRYRAMGRDVWWYTCCSPMYPYANNASYEHAVIECRLLGWLTRLVRADGYLYWHVNHWLNPENKLDEQHSFFPKWRTDTWPMMPGDGVFIYPGKRSLVSSIRLANVRDGVEDYEWMLLAERRVGRNAVEDMLRKVVTSAKKFSRDASILRRIRSELADVIE